MDKRSVTIVDGNKAAAHAAGIELNVYVIAANPNLPGSAVEQRYLDVLKYLMAGADVVMTTSALLQHEVDYLGTLLQQVRAWVESHEYESVSQMKGSLSQRNVTDASAFRILA